MPALWDLPDFDAHESVHLFDDPKTGLRAVIAIHSTHLGPAAGGTRFWHYADQQAALTDALRLSRGMSYKNAMAGLPAGGGKAVILANANRSKSRELLDAFARAVDSLGGRYITAQDVGMSEADVVTLSHTTKHVAGLPGQGGDPGPYTARGVYLGVKAAAKRALGSEDVKGMHFAIQGVGSVGGGLARYLAAEGARLTLADVNADRAASLAAELGAETVATDAIMAVEADVFSPCALGAILTETSVTSLKVKAVAGGANNQLATAKQGRQLADRGIVYAPDYVINAGGIINVLRHIDHADDAAINARIDTIPGRLHQIWDESEASGDTPAEVADRIAQGLIGR
ncbi:MAG TPA: Glu/Leu/Phe/Val dehydrogenase dimerization domain-containing protein [Sphingorhabdus sp.]|jgi:leucine dehydrogenase|uniref:Leu/Phe/Val dehydrogenase n=1 Tax=Sphingorhabdus sp. TaxID=1902408 RepID=UPI002CBA37E1|nr:Glu/Leu/Phe/Val dehydrogenase dimerization domain-containing protein [Sphingorhabdus sp.]HMT40571.1 Glu/Leu/Phe/Val dehydrogenase dimerization domain-containing protein [Sphingorhabdus sp.]HMU21748.1 Glu/Leu/Phe/Val dehydrogenase dimerization domain-containing protein [Sphingorhabdus sp.]